MKIYAISGLGADSRVFDYLALENKLIPLDWIKPLPNEHIENYAKRFAEQYKLDKKGDFVIIGLSFGGLIATEISKTYSPKLTILISSAETNKELNSIIKLAGKLKITNVLPKHFFDPPRSIANFLFGTNNKELLNTILDDTDLEFAKWAVTELVNWKNTKQLDNVLKIGGNKDKLLPPKDKRTVIVDGGEHFMIVDKAKEISDIINEKLRGIIL